MRTTLTIAKAADLPRLLPLVKAYYAFDGIDFDRRRATRALRELLGSPGWGRTWLVLHDGNVIGYVILCFSYSVENGGRDALIDEFFLQEPYRGRGIGRRVLRHVFAAARRAGIKSIYLEVSRGNRRARRFYRTLGFHARDRYSLMDLQLPLPSKAASARHK